MFTRRELQRIGEKARIVGLNVANPHWKRACVALEDATDRLDAMVARSTEHKSESPASARMGTIEPIFVNSEPHKPGDPADRMAFIRGCLKKYRGTAVSDESILGYIEQRINGY